MSKKTEIIVGSECDGFTIMVDGKTEYRWSHDDAIGLGMDDFLKKMFPDAEVTFEEWY
jgi:hypothetical protein